VPLSPCLESGCGNLSTYRGRCQAHRRRKARATYKERGSLYRKAKWLRTREAVLSQEPWCRACKGDGRETLATQVDHIVPVEQGGDKWNLAGLQPLCSSHHGQKTRREQRNRGEGTPGVSKVR
jgi:5-methylcytosine-specific restriction protein A